MLPIRFAIHSITKTCLILLSAIRSQSKQHQPVASADVQTHLLFPRTQLGIRQSRIG